MCTFIKEDFKCIENRNVNSLKNSHVPSTHLHSSLTHGQSGLVSFLPTSHHITYLSGIGLF